MQRVVYGLHAVAELLRNPRAEVSALFVIHSRDVNPAEVGRFSDLRKQAAQRGLQPVDRSRTELDRLARGGVHQGVLALCGAYQYADGVAELLARIEEDRGTEGVAPLLLILDGVTDPQNLGALVRSAHVLGGHGVVVPKD